MRRLSDSIGAVLLAVLMLYRPSPASGQTLTFEQAVGQLSSADPRIRLRSVELLMAAGYPEAAVPLARTVTDPDDEVQFAGIAAELNLFLANKVTPKKRVGLIVEVRGRVEAEPIFSSGPSALGAARVPREVITALTTACRDRNLRVAVEAVYAFGVLAGEVSVADRPAMLAESAPILAGMVGVPDPMLRLAAVRVIGRVWAHRPQDPPINDSLGDAVIAALNDREDPIRETAMWSLGVMKNERGVQALGDLFQYYRKGPLADAAFDALARIGHPGSTPFFTMQLSVKNTNPTYRMMAIEGLSRGGDPAHLDAIHAALNKERNEALLLSGHLANALLADGPIDNIVESLTRARLHDQAVQYVQDVAYGRTALFAKHLKDPDERLRAELIEVLGLSGDGAAVQLILPLLKDRDADVAEAAARALARLGAAIPPA